MDEQWKKLSELHKEKDKSLCYKTFKQEKFLIRIH